MLGWVCIGLVFANRTKGTFSAPNSTGEAPRENLASLAAVSQPRPPWWLLVVATLAVAVSKLLLARFRTTTVLTVLAGCRPSRHRQLLDVDLAARSVASASRLLRADCLPQAVALAVLLQRGGAEPTVVLGCRFYGPSRWGAHAWVEVDGKRFDPLAQEKHAELGRLTADECWGVRAG